MKLTKFGHACVRVEADGGTLVIDPGGFTEAGAVDGADAILITHEHPDHFIESRVREAVAANPGVQVWTVAAVAESLTGLGEQLHVVGHGDAFTAAGFEVETHGTWHAEIHRDIPRVANSGFLINQRLFHPGDALTVPDKPIDTLLLPVHAPWSRISDLIDWLREVAPTRALAVHDGLLNSNGLGLVGGLLGERGPGVGTSYLRIEPLDTMPDV